MNEELLARFIVQSNHVRGDQTVRPQAFMPHPERLDMSMTKHDGRNESNVWRIGGDIARARIPSKTLYGRADIKTTDIPNSLSVQPAPVAENQDHMNIIGWPKDKSAQISLAQQIALRAGFIPKLSS